MRSARGSRFALCSLLVLLLSAAPVFATVVPDPAPPPATRLLGTVRDGSGAAVKGADVFAFTLGAYPEGAAHGVTNAAGAYVLDLPAGGTYQVAASEEKHLGAFHGGADISRAKAVTIGLNTTKSGIDATLTAKPMTAAAGSFAGIVPDGKTRLLRKSEVRVAGNRAAWQDMWEVILREGVLSGPASESNLTTETGVSDMNAQYAYVGRNRIDLATKATTELTSDEPISVACDDDWVVMVFSTFDETDGTETFRAEARRAGETSATTWALPADTMSAQLSPGAVAGGKVVVAFDADYGIGTAAVYDCATGHLQQTVPEAETVESAVLANGKVVWSTGTSVRSGNLSGALAASDVVAAGASSIGRLAADGTRVVYAEDKELFDGEDFLGVKDTYLRSHNLENGAESTLFSHPGTMPASIDGGYDISADYVVWLDGIAGGVDESILGQSAEEVWGGKPADVAARLDSARYADADQDMPALAGGHLAWLDNGTYAADDMRWDLRIKDTDASPGAADTVATDVEYAGDAPLALTPRILAFTKSDAFGDSEIWWYDVIAKTAPKKLLGGLDMPTVRADGTWVLYTVPTAGYLGEELRAIDTAKPGMTPVLVYKLSIGILDFSASNGKVLFSDSAGAIWSYDLTTATKKASGLPSGVLGGFVPFAADLPRTAYARDFGSVETDTEMFEFGTLVARNLDTGVSFTADPFTTMGYGSGLFAVDDDFLLSGGQVLDITSGRFCSLPDPGGFPLAGDIGGTRVVIETYDESAGDTDLVSYDFGGDLPRPTERLSGPSRYETAVSLSREFASAGTVVIATGRKFPDALAGAPLAHAVKGPVLLTASDSLLPAVSGEVTRLGAKTAYILGSESVVSVNVETQLKGLGVTTVTRLKGNDRFETAREIAEELLKISGRSTITTAFVATGRRFPDALAASAVAARMGSPILLTESGSIPKATLDALVTCGIEDVVVLGSDKVVSAGVASSLGAARRLQGTDRYLTARAIVDYGFEQGVLTANGAVVAIGNNFPDALAAGVLAGSRGHPLLLVDRAAPDVPAPTRSFLVDHKSTLAGNVTLVGGESALPLALQQRISQLLR